MIRKYTHLAVLIFILIFSNVKAQNRIDHTLWDQLLLLNVSKDGIVDYQGFIRDKFLFNKYFKSLSTQRPEKKSSKEEKLAYWVNLYNAIVLKMIIDNYPVESINDIKKPWKQKQITIDNKQYSLDDIEHTVLRKMNEPRVHFLLNSGSKSSPKLWNMAYTSRNINKALEEHTKQFINDPSKNSIKKDNVLISEVFEWYKNDFNDGNIIAFINEYSDIKIQKKSKKRYKKYDWSLPEN
ncbi:DUF547 domain-containing protein [Aquimarina sp. RZ0]|uniref:DUF547 domain-containing protein n=1 Tax=Aquimarina sp. RZ0 TaxID=2607730 RepID=UPI0011F1FB50|nr:DUF547 domain-containing protein [Aquimarina sp. RZ0]KAA1244108.1 DUF547 domain-containing protein [Aquimarina sp. RZ0]